eukprot:CAMPEP_0173159080 /NCGR_PEP_ID=MMETSP1105-20130129/16854_1 /TAXON_ID=2985 /ORGANISM="Ochromonas sp., Strain BG-1" /LENGTH=201 /DNA_ID=CAMNT_0014077361 /DNA_START=71 /DNA_END=676 /DNA_ORIENTATION=+
MFKFLALVAFLYGASAFAPSSVMMKKTINLKMGFENEIGAQPPLGLWDPLGLLKNADQSRFDRLRTVETKHGRIAMLAILGHLVTAAGNRLPGEIAYGVPFTNVRAGLAAFSDIPAAGTFQLLLFIGLLELGFGSVQKSIEEDCARYAESAGINLAKKSAVELNNGRAAQMGILALMVHEKLNNDPYVINALLGSPVPFNQ